MPAAPNRKPAPISRESIVEHAVAILNHHAPCFGTRAAVRDPDDEAWRIATPAPECIDSLPAEVREPLILAMANAAKFLARVFEETTD